MVDDKPQPHLTLVDGSYTHSVESDEFAPLPFFPWDERPANLPLDREEVRTSLVLSHGDLARASTLLKVPIIRLSRYIRATPALRPLLEELRQVLLIKASSVPISTLFDPRADARRLEWAATKILSSKIAQGHDLSPAPANAPVSAALTSREIVYSWRSSQSGPSDDE